MMSAAAAIVASLCAASSSTPPQGALVIESPFGPPGPGHAGVVAQIAIDADFEFFLLNGADVDATLDAIEQVVGHVGGIFRAGPGVAFDVTGVVIRDDADDPYSGDDAGVLLAQLEDEWLTNHPDIEWDTVQLFTGRNLNGAVFGLSGQSSICTTGAFSLVAGAVLALADRIHLSAHELGHVFGADHCDGPDCGVMCP
jgi:Metallo-peptidase family M12